MMMMMMTVMMMMMMMMMTIIYLECRAICQVSEDSGNMDVTADAVLRQINEPRHHVQTPVRKDLAKSVVIGVM
jgi:hypothetical protein